MGNLRTRYDDKDLSQRYMTEDELKILGLQSEDSTKKHENVEINQDNNAFDSAKERLTAKNEQAYK